MKPFALLLSLLLLAGCTERDRADAARSARAKADEVAVEASDAARKKAGELADQAVAGAKNMAESLWLSAQREAERVTKDSSEDALRAARSKMLDLQSQLADLKAPTDLQALQQTNVETQIARLEAAIDMREIQSKIENATSEATRKALRDQLSEAKQNYAAAMEQAEEYRAELKNRGVPMP